VHISGAYWGLKVGEDLYFVEDSRQHVNTAHPAYKYTGFMVLDAMIYPNVPKCIKMRIAPT
jgi:hypothetical protein